MKRLILSRKGFDSSAGGGPSPILNDGRIFSLPIPQKEKSPFRYSDLKFDEFNGEDFIKKIKCSVSSETFCHFDPRLDQEIGIFGQANAAQTELKNKDIQTGDLFLFFGWFKNLSRSGRDLHHIFGWLQINKIIEGEKKIKKFLLENNLQHPHGFEDVSRYKNNTLYIGAKKLSFDKKIFNCNGSGLFKKTHKNLILTEPHMTRSNWKLPVEFLSSKNIFLNRLKWRDKKNLKVAYKGFGQEFILDVEKNPKVAKWAINLILNHE